MTQQPPLRASSGYPLRLDAPLRAELDASAAELGLSLSALLTAVLCEHLARSGRAVPPPAEWRSGPVLDREGDRERVRAAWARARRLPVKAR